jgi:hypothetical protein
MALQTATNPDTGERVVLIGDAWQPIEKSATNEAGAKAYLSGGKWHTENTKAPPKDKSFLEVLETVEAAGTRPFKQVAQTIKGFGADILDAVSPKAPTLSGQIVGETTRRQNVDAERAAETQAYKQQYGSDRLAQAVNLYSEAGLGAYAATGIGKVLGAVAQAVPAAAKYLTPLAESITSGGFKTGLGPTGAIKATTNLPAYTARNVATEVATRAGGGAIAAGTGAGIINPEDVKTAATVGALLPTAGYGVVKAGATGLGKALDLFSGRGGDVKAAQIARTALGDQLEPALIALANARPGITAVQVLQEAGIDAAPFMALGVFTKDSSIREGYRRLATAQTQGFQNELATMAGGRTQTEVAESLRAGKNALNDVTTPMREVNLQASNQYDQTARRLEPYIAQKEASMVSALQGQGQAATNAAQQTNLARGGVIPATMGTPPNLLPSPLGGTGVPQPMGVAMQAGLPRISPSVTLNAERAVESGVVADTMAAIKAQRQSERDFLQRQMGSLEAYGLKPLDINPILNVIDSKLADPNLYGQSQLLNVLRGLRDDFTGAVTANGGVADARALYSMRKAGISQRIDDMYGTLDPSSKQRLTADVLASIKKPIDNAIIEAGGTGWNRYLQTFETGMQQLDQQRLAALALDRFKGDQAGFLKLVRGEDKDAIEKIFGYGSDNIFKEMGRKSGQLENIASQLERDVAIETSANQAKAALARIMKMSESKIQGFPALFDKSITTLNAALRVLRGQVNEKTFAAFEKGMISGKSAAEMLAQLPTSERNLVFRLLKNSSEWNSGAANVVTQLTARRVNQLAPEKRNRNNLRQ